MGSRREGAGDVDWELRSIMLHQSETLRPQKAEAANYAHSEPLADWLVRLGGWGSSALLPLPDPAGTQHTSALNAETSFAPHAQGLKPYAFSKPGAAGNQQPTAATAAAATAAAAAAAADDQPKSKSSKSDDDGVHTPPSSEAGGSADDGPHPTKLIKAEFFRLRKVQAPFLNMDAFLAMEDPEKRSVDPALVLLDSSRARIPASKEYYHASYVDGYSTPRQFLLAQAPTRKRVKAFWSLMAGHKVPLLVVLGAPRAADPFWPGGPEMDLTWDDNSVYVGRLGAVAQGPGYRLMELRVRVDGAEERMDLMELAWETEAKVPMELLAVAGRALAQHEHSQRRVRRAEERAEKERKAKGGQAPREKASPPPLGLVCWDGVRRSGTFAAAAIALERLIVTGEAELTETCKALRLQRYGALHHCLHFLQLHLLLLHHLGVQGKTGKFKLAELERLEAELAHHIRDLKPHRLAHNPQNPSTASTASTNSTASISISSSIYGVPDLAHN
jgi:hypothetical protein